MYTSLDQLADRVVGAGVRRVAGRILGDEIAPVTAVLTACSADLALRLAVAGRDATLARRLVGTHAAGRVRAKTGSIHGIPAFAGYAHGEGGTNVRLRVHRQRAHARFDGSASPDALAAALVAPR